MRSIGLWAIVIAAIAFIVGFWNFANDVRQDVVEEPPPAEAIVALTGGSLERLSTGVRLLEQHKGQRLLISGVNRIVTDAELFEVLELDGELAECCVDLGRSADDTLGNAAETAAWAREHNYTRLILVTDDYHMPRSRAELTLAMPEVEIYPYPVQTRWTDPDLWRSDIGAASRIGAEYVKYLVIRGREALIGLGSNAEDGDTEPA
ncbi:YdcF family protein [Terricaulis silvestris]|uniref:DUF218 domain-containing protein n=1 Tax=Terricaulis silvestris TaxID=2686094 RepID=A0A6I6MLB5_9CAUL|nr:YdcF family protein [Terricaulis silvestris]QGZ96050.1 hypothetical protein DSM104635_02906 [Terricaulis silvestris]